MSAAKLGGRLLLIGWGLMLVGCDALDPQAAMLAEARERQALLDSIGEENSDADADEESAKEAPPAKKEAKEKSPPAAKEIKPPAQAEKTPAAAAPNKEQAAEAKAAEPAVAAARPKAPNATEWDKQRPRPVSDQERHAWSVENLQRIGDALRAYHADQGHYPTNIYDPRSGEMVLSWRVALLPYLGYESLYQKFKLDQGALSSANRKLLEEIPTVYQSPERFDEKTNYLAPLQRNSLLTNTATPRSGPPADGANNTLMLVEVNDRYAQPWSAPVDFEHERNSLRMSLGELRKDGSLVVWASGQVALIKKDLSKKELRAAVSIDGGEELQLAALCRLPQWSASAASAVTASNVDAAAPETSPGLAEVEGDENGKRLPVPDEAAQATAKELIRRIYRETYDAAKTPAERKQLTKRMLNDAARYSRDPAGRYMLYDLAATIASRDGDVTTAMAAVDAKCKRFMVESLPEKLKILEQATKTAVDDQGTASVIEATGAVVDAAIVAGDVATAKAAIRLATPAARRSGQGALLNRVGEFTRHVEEVEAQLVRVSRAQLVMEIQEEDPRANFEVGKYLCLMRNQWGEGLPNLARGSDAMLQALAARDLAQPRDLHALLVLGLDYWHAAAQAERLAQWRLRERALHFLAQSLPYVVRTDGVSLNLPATLNYLEQRQTRFRSTTNADERRKQLDEILATKDALVHDPVTHVAALLLVIDFGLEIGHPDAVLQAMNAIVEAYEIDFFELKQFVLARISYKHSPDLETSRVLFIAADDLVSEGIIRGDFDLAGKMHAMSVAAARRGASREQMTAIVARDQEIERAEKFANDVNAAVAKLSLNSDDREANLMVGKYLCFVLGKWDKGLPMLAKGSDAGLAVLAQRELAGTTDTTAMIELGNGWWEYGETQDQVQRHNTMLRAVRWYLRCRDQLTNGLVRSDIEKKLRDAAMQLPKRKIEQAVK